MQPLSFIAIGNVPAQGMTAPRRRSLEPLHDQQHSPFAETARRFDVAAPVFRIAVAGLRRSFDHGHSRSRRAPKSGLETG
jgi:hypothetical protein